MQLPEPQTLVIPAEGAAFDARLQSLPNHPAVFLLWPHEGAPYLARTNVLRRRLLRLLRERQQPSRLLNLRSVARRIEYWPTASQLEASLVLYELALRHFPDSYLELLKLRMPHYVKVLLANEFPRTQITTRLSGSKALHYGPFRSHASAELFDGQFLDLFQVRRCQEDLEPSPNHPGCIYGEMNMCLRPCQKVVGEAEYHSEVVRVVDFLRTGGHSLLDNIATARDRFSEEMDFEEAARQHKRFEKVQLVLKLRDELVRDIDQLCGVAVTASVTENAVNLWFVLDGCWQDPSILSYEVVEGKTVSLDRKLREAVASLKPRKLSLTRRQEHLALLARWYYSTWRRGEWIAFDELANLPYRRLVNAIHRIAVSAT